MRGETSSIGECASQQYRSPLVRQSAFTQPSLLGSQIVGRKLSGSPNYRCIR